MGLSQRNQWMMSASSNLIAAIAATFNMSKIEKRDGYKDGDQMKISKAKLKEIILEEIKEACGGNMPMQMQSPCADDHEASMAKADLHKLANYAAELEQMIQDGEELEGWVQAKITKAADYISSVKHYLEYEKMGNLQEQEDGPGLTTGTMSTAARQKASRERIASTGEEFSPQEKSIVDQIEKFLSGLASAEGVDLMRHKPFLVG